MILWAKYRDEFKLDDFPGNRSSDSISYNGRIYSMPILTNTEMFFYREDLFRESGLALPKTMQDYMEAAEKLHQGRVSGTIMTLKPVDGCLNDAHWYLNALGEGWFDKELEANLQSAGRRKSHHHDEADDSIRPSRLYVCSQRRINHQPAAGPRRDGAAMVHARSVNG